MTISLYATLLAIEVIAVEPGTAHVRAEVREVHTNHFGFAHGGFINSVADFALELASNSHGVSAVALTTNTQYHRPAPIGTVLEAKAHETYLGKTTATYHIEINADDKRIASFTGTVYRKS
jgi:acyl-CoA thioesterase